MSSRFDNPSAEPSSFTRRWIKEIIDEPSLALDFRTVRSVVLRNHPHINDGEILKIARASGKLSPLMEAWIVNNLRSEIFLSNLDRKITRDKPFIPQLRALAQEEKEGSKLASILDECQPLVEQFRTVSDKKTKDAEVTEEEQKLFDRVRKLQFEIAQLVIHCKATFALYFFDNGDLKWLWGASEDDLFQNPGRGNDGLVEKSEGGRVGDLDESGQW